MIPVERLFVATIADDAEALARKHGVGVELDEFCTAANMDGVGFVEWSAQARQMLEASSRHILHAPFAELSPAAIDPMIREVVMQRYEQAYGIAWEYGIKRMVVHAGYIPDVYQPEWFIERSAAFWRAFLRDKPDDFTLLIENVLEDNPQLLLEVIERISDPRVQICLDVGHAFVQSDCPLTDWIDTLAPHIGHVHLHNNDGKHDAHNAVDDGKIPMRSVIKQLLSKLPETSTFALEMRHAGPSLEAVLPSAPEEFDDVPRAVLKRTFGYDDFREGQRELVEAQMAGCDALGVMPTGSGKSICFQLPALMKEGVTLVISPLISLMKDQVTALNQAGVRAAYLNSSLTERQMEIAMRNAEAGEYRIIYVAPERLFTGRFLAYATGADIALIAVDEAHCISQWGQDFRPSYLDIPRFVGMLGARPPVSAFTATATPQVKADIIRLLALENPVQVQTGFDRPNLYYEVQRPKRKDEALLTLMNRYKDQSGIVYCATRKAVDEVCALLCRNGILATRYHAGLPDDERHANQDDFTFDRCSVIVATNAFGMGIDKSNIRFVIHFNMPKDLESYYQEAGRAGRDGERAECVLLYNGQDVTIQRYLIEQEDGNANANLTPALREKVQQSALHRLQEMVSYSRTQRCLRAHILRYFGEGDLEPCGNCGSCGSRELEQDVTDVALPMLRCIKECGEMFGLGTIIEVLKGSNSQRLQQFRLTRQPSFGMLRAESADRLKAIGEQLIEEGYLYVKTGKLPIVALGPRAGMALSGGEAVMVKLPPAVQTEAKVAKAAAAEGGLPMDEGLFETLRSLRFRLAAQHGVPAFLIFSDATLKDMSARKPRSREEMLRVKGVGESKIRMYGAEFLRQIEQYYREEENVVHLEEASGRPGRPVPRGRA